MCFIFILGCPSDSLWDCNAVGSFNNEPTTSDRCLLAWGANRKFHDGLCSGAARGFTCEQT